MSNSLQSHGLYSPWNSPGQNTGVGSHSLLQGIFPIQGSNPCLPHCRWILYQLSHKGSLRILEWVANPFSRGSSLLRNWTGVSCITGRFLTNWGVRESGGVKSCLKSNPIPDRHSEGSNKTLCAPGPRGSTETEPDMLLSVWVSPAEARVSSGLLWGQGLWLQ